jgi:hypothetical protein
MERGLKHRFAPGILSKRKASARRLAYTAQPERESNMPEACLAGQDHLRPPAEAAKLP